MASLASGYGHLTELGIQGTVPARSETSARLCWIGCTGHRHAERDLKNAMAIEIPSVIAECDEYQSLDAEERGALLRRMRDAAQLGDSLFEGSRSGGYPDFFQFVEDLELDVSHMQEYGSRPGSALTRWQVHYSWTFYASPQQMRSTLPSLVLDLIDANEPPSSAPFPATEQWLKDLGRGLTLSVSGIANAQEYPSAVANMIAVDILLGRVLSACYRLRLNPLVPR